MNTIPVKVLIPIYKNDLNKYEQIALKQCCNVLSGYPIVFVKPLSLDITPWLELYPNCTSESFDDHFFQGIAGYNELMLSTLFYERFLDSTYILIHQLDAYVFEDKLMNWVNKNYDYVGAPWILKPKYHRFYYRVLLAMRAFGYWLKNEPFNLRIIGDKVGNGGFSLRRVEAHYRQTKLQQKKIQYFLNQSVSYQEFNEDVFWATQNPNFVYPTWQEAMAFALDTYPEIGYELLNHQTPFGCHGWTRPKTFAFWQEKIKNNEKYLR